VDVSADPGGLIRFLDAANAIAGLRAAKSALMEQLVLGRARAALDVGCGVGGDVAEMARLMPDGTHVSGLDTSETMIAEARRRAASLGTRFPCGSAMPLTCPTATGDLTPAGQPPSCSMSRTRRALSARRLA